MKTQTVITGYIVEESSRLSLVELCNHCHTHAEAMIKLVDHGIISPCPPCDGQVVSQWRFESSALIRANKALRLQHDLGINLAGTALALELLDEIDTLRTLLDCADNHQASVATKID